MSLQRSLVVLTQTMLETPVFTLTVIHELSGSVEFMQDDDDEDWFPEDIYEAFKEMRERKIFDVSDMYTLADAWGWTWEREIKMKPLQRWSQEWEVELAIKIMEKAYFCKFFITYFTFIFQGDIVLMLPSACNCMELAHICLFSCFPGLLIFLTLLLL